MKIASEAQRQMFERCASDPAYARERGISAETAQQFLDAHEKAGNPKLPDRARIQDRVPLPRDGFDPNQPITWDDAMARLDGDPWPRRMLQSRRSR